MSIVRARDGIFSEPGRAHKSETSRRPFSLEATSPEKRNFYELLTILGVQSLLRVHVWSILFIRYSDIPKYGRIDVGRLKFDSYTKLFVAFFIIFIRNAIVSNSSLRCYHFHFVFTGSEWTYSNTNRGRQHIFSGFLCSEIERATSLIQRHFFVSMLCRNITTFLLRTVVFVEHLWAAIEAKPSFNG